MIVAWSGFSLRSAPSDCCVVMTAIRWFRDYLRCDIKSAGPATVSDAFHERNDKFGSFAQRIRRSHKVPRAVIMWCQNVQERAAFYYRMQYAVRETLQSPFLTLTMVTWTAVRAVRMRCVAGKWNGWDVERAVHTRWIARCEVRKEEKMTTTHRFGENSVLGEG